MGLGLIDFSASEPIIEADAERILYTDITLDFTGLAGRALRVGSAEDGMSFIGDLSLIDNEKLTLGAGDDLQLYHTGTGSLITNAVGTFFIYNFSQGDEFQFRGYDADGDVGEIWFDPDFGGTSSNLSLRMKYDNSILTFGAGDDLQLYHDGTDSWIINATGNLLIRSTSLGDDVRIWGADASGDIGQIWFDPDFGGTSANLSIRMLYDNSKLTLGAGDDLQLYHDGTDSFITNATGALKVNSTNSGILIAEIAAAGTDTAGYGQLWVKNATPCELWFTDDAGTDTQIV